MDIIIYIDIFVLGVGIGLIIGLTLWLKQLSDDITQFEIERANIQAELEVLKDQTDGNYSKWKSGNR